MKMMILNKYHKPFKDASNYVVNLYLQGLIIFIIIKPVKGERLANVSPESRSNFTKCLFAAG